MLKINAIIPPLPYLPLWNAQWQLLPVEHGISNVIIMNSMSELLPFWVLCSYNEHVLYLMITYARKLFING